MMDSKINLMADEQVILETKPAWASLILAPILSMLVGVLLFGFGLSMLSKNGLWGFLGLLGFAMAAESPAAPLQAVPATARVVDLRPAEERQIEQEAQRDLGDDESIARQLRDLIRQSNSEYGKDMDAYKKTSARSREIGEYLCANGGDPRMKKVGYRVKALGGNTRILEDFWDGICGWMV